MPAFLVESQVFNHFQEGHAGVAKDTERAYNGIDEFNLLIFRC